MCQMAAYMSYASWHNRDLYLVITEKNNDKLKQYEGYLPLLRKFLFLRKSKVAELYEVCDIYIEPSNFEYKPIPDFEKQVVLLNGFWQNEKFFDEKLVKETFAIPQEYKDRLFEKYGDLSEATSISVRHGDDYVKQQSHFVVPSGEWYEKAYEKYFPNTKVIITSDDVDWAKENIRIENAVFVEKEDKEDVFWDMYVCVLCKNHIIYPGSYGWLGAWLGEKEASQVVCPDKWWGPKNSHISEEIVPDRWIRFKL
jgi:hypothetical protein